MFIELSRDVSQLWRNHSLALLFICLVVVLCGYALNCNNFQCAIIIVQVLMILFCVMWSILAWKIRMLLEKKIKDADAATAEEKKKIR